MQKNNVFIFILTGKLVLTAFLLLCSCSTNTSKNEITSEIAFEGVNNYCHNTYDWSVAEDNQSIMYIEMGEETDTTYQVVFRSYTGAFVYFYVNKTSGITKMEEYVPTLDIRDEVGSINIFDYI